MHKMLFTYPQCGTFWTLLFSLVFLVLAFLAIPQPSRIVEIDGVRTYVDSDSWVLRNIEMTEVESVDWAPHLEFTKKLVTTRTPFILKNSLVRDWKALNLWSQPDYLVKHPSLQNLIDVKVSKMGTMTDQSVGRPLTPLLVNGLAEGAHRVVNMSSTAFFDAIVDPHEQNSYYYYGKVDLELKKDLMPNQLLWVLPDDAASNELYLWLGGPGIGPALHYDMDHNFFIQVVGRKRFILIPPWQSAQVYPYPSLHPYDRKAQVDWERPNASLHPSFASITPLVANLEPGDLLYVPPYWWHKVHSITPSASLSALSTSGVFQSMKPLYSRNLTVDSLEVYEQQAGLMVFLAQVIGRLFKDNRQALLPLLAARWESVKDQLRLKDIECPTEEAFEEGLFETDVAFAVNAFLNVQTVFGAAVDPARRDMDAIIRTELLDWIEVTVASVVPADQVYSFIQKCVALDTFNSRE